MITFPASTGSLTLTFPVLDEGCFEIDETLIITISNTASIVVTTDSATALITDSFNTGDADNDGVGDELDGDEFDMQGLKALQELLEVNDDN